MTDRSTTPLVENPATASSSLRQGFTLLVGAEGSLLAELSSLLAGQDVPCVDLRALGGEPTAIDFGLSGLDYRALVERCGEVIVACEPEAEVGSDVERTRAVRAAAEVLEFVRSGGAPRGVVFLSSLLVFGNASGHVDEQAFQIGQGFSSKFEEVLAVAERVVRHADGSVPLRVLRIAPIVGDVARGVVPESSPLAQIVARVERVPAVSETSFADQPIRFDTTDRVARALVGLRAHPKAVTVHLVDDNAPTDRQLLDWLGDHAAREFRDPVQGSRARRHKNPLEDLASPARRALRGWSLRFGRENAEKLLPELLDRPVDVVLERLLGPRTRKDQ